MIQHGFVLDLGVSYIPKSLLTKRKYFRIATELHLEPPYEILRDWHLKDNLGFVFTTSTISVQINRKYHQAYHQFGTIRT